MPRPPNYTHERKDQERIKAAKKAEKLAVKQAASVRRVLIQLRSKRTGLTTRLGELSAAALRR